MARTQLSPDELDLRGRKARPSRAAVNVPAFTPGRPIMPKNLTGLARAEWKRLVRELMRRGTSTKLDASILELHCQTYQRWRACLEEIEGKLFVDVPVLDSNGQFVGMRRKVNPALAIAQKCEATLKQTLTQLGATPASRKVSQITKPEKPEAKPPLDEGDAFLAENPRDPDVIEFPRS